MNLVMNLRDIALWEQGRLKAFAVPQTEAEDLSVGQTVGIKEPFKKLTVTEVVEKDGEPQEKKMLVGVMYRSDGQIVWTDGQPDKYDEASRWSPASQLPEFAVRRHAIIISADEGKPIRAITEDELKLMCLDYDSQNDPQLLLKEYLPTKNFELLYLWWKNHYKATLRDCDNPIAILVRIQANNFRK